MAWRLGFAAIFAHTIEIGIEKSAGADLRRYVGIRVSKRPRLSHRSDRPGFSSGLRLNDDLALIG